MTAKIQIVTAFLVSLLLVHPPVSADTHISHSERLDWQERMLLQPTHSQLSAEQDGRITIYDSLEYSLVDEALDLHFDRMENMMFIRIHHLPATGAGNISVEKDGCE